MSETISTFVPPPGDYAIVELLGHTTLVGRITEVERFGTKMLAIEVLFNETLLDPILQGGASIYRLTPCSPDVAARQHPRRDWHLPSAIRCIVPPAMLEAPGEATLETTEDARDDDDRPF